MKNWCEEKKNCWANIQAFSVDVYIYNSKKISLSRFFYPIQNQTRIKFNDDDIKCHEVWLPNNYRSKSTELNPINVENDLKSIWMFVYQIKSSWKFKLNTIEAFSVNICLNWQIMPVLQAIFVHKLSNFSSYEGNFLQDCKYPHSNVVLCRVITSGSGLWTSNWSK